MSDASGESSEIDLTVSDEGGSGDEQRLQKTTTTDDAPVIEVGSDDTHVPPTIPINGAVGGRLVRMHIVHAVILGIASFLTAAFTNPLKVHTISYIVNPLSLTNSSIPVETAVLFSYPQGILVFLPVIIGTMLHIIAATCARGRYDKWIAWGFNPLRWLDYVITFPFLVITALSYSSYGDAMGLSYAYMTTLIVTICQALYEFQRAGKSRIVYVRPSLSEEAPDQESHADPLQQQFKLATNNLRCCWCCVCDSATMLIVAAHVLHFFIFLSMLVYQADAELRVGMAGVILMAFGVAAPALSSYATCGFISRYGHRYALHDSASYAVNDLSKLCIWLPVWLATQTLF